MRQPTILALAALDDAKALTALKAPIIGDSGHLFLREAEGDALVVLLGSKVSLDGLPGTYDVVMLMPHSDGKGGSEHGPAVAAKLTTAVADEAAKGGTPSIKGPFSLADFVHLFPVAETKLTMRLLDVDGVLRCPQVFAGDDPYALCGTEPKVPEPKGEVEEMAADQGLTDDEYASAAASFDESNDTDQDGL